MARRPTFQPQADQPQDGQVVVFSRVPAGSYCSIGVPYRVEAPRHPKGDYRFVNVERGSSTYDAQWSVRRAEWVAQAVA